MNIFSWAEFTTFLIRRRLKVWLAVIALYLSIAGLVTFSLFILEESFQTIMFGTWPAQDAKRWDIVLDGTDLMEKTTKIMRVVNYSCGWIQPLAFISYGAYAESADFYVKGLRSKVLAYAPELMTGREIKLNFRITQIKKHKNKFILSNGRLVILSNKREHGSAIIKGTLMKTEVGYELINIHGGTFQ